MRIGFWLLQDSIQQWTSWIAGLHYVINCLEALGSLDARAIPQVSVFLSKPLEKKFRESLRVRQAAWLKLILVDDSELLTSEGLRSLEALVAREACQAFFPIMTPPIVPLPGKTIAWIADYQHQVHPEFFGLDDRLFRDKLFSFLTCIADRIVCSSRAVESHLEEFYPTAAARSFVLRFTALPPDSALTGDTKATLSRLSVASPYVYLPYQFWAHKNHRVAFEAWRLLKRRGRPFSLVCSGATGDARNPRHFNELRHFLSEHRLDDSVRVLGVVDRDDQWQLYRGARFVLQPSLFEGWSTSVEEARSLGKPIVLSDIPVHREQLEDAGCFFPPHDAAALADLIETYWDKFPDRLSPEEEQHAVSQHRLRVNEFGRQLLKLFEEAIAENRESIAKQTVPLLAFFQFEAKARLRVIENLTKEIDSIEKTTSVANLNQDASPTEIGSIVPTERTLIASACRWLARKLSKYNHP